MKIKDLLEEEGGTLHLLVSKTGRCTPGVPMVMKF
jgi:hypothetical protein